MTKALLALVLAFAWPAQDGMDGPAEEPAQDDGLKAACEKGAALKNYTFKMTTEVEGMKGGGGLPATEVKITPDNPWQITMGPATAWRKGEAIVANVAGEWKKIDMARKKDGGGEKLERKTMAALLAAGAKAPHEILVGLDAKLSEVQRTGGDGGVTYAGVLSEEAAGEFGALGLKGNAAPGGKKAGKFTGTAKLWVNADGAVTKIEVFVEGTLPSKDAAPREVKKSVVYELSAIDSTTVEVPDEVKTAFGE